MELEKAMKKLALSEDPCSGRNDLEKLFKKMEFEKELKAFFEKMEMKRKLREYVGCAEATMRDSCTYTAIWNDMPYFVFNDVSTFPRYKTVNVHVLPNCDCKSTKGFRVAIGGDKRVSVTCVVSFCQGRLTNSSLHRGTWSSAMQQQTRPISSIKISIVWKQKLRCALSWSPFLPSTA
jgi:hypothetical protein